MAKRLVTFSQYQAAMKGNKALRFYAKLLKKAWAKAEAKRKANIVCLDSHKAPGDGE